MNIAVFPAADWNKLCAILRRSWPFQGRGIRLIYGNEGGVVIEAILDDEFEHPWQVRPYWQPLDGGTGEWRAYIRPGFVNGRDVWISAAALTDEPTPFLSLTDLRDPAAPSGQSINSDGDTIYGRAEGYPAIFDQLSVVPAAHGGFTQGGGAQTDKRNRLIRACDIVLTQPRVGSALDITVLDPLTDNFTHSLSTTYTNAYYIATQGRASLTAHSKYTPLIPTSLDSPLLSLPLYSGDPQFDQKLIATVWMISPPKADPTKPPDSSWQVYPQHFTFWNLMHATRFKPPAIALPPLKLNTGLGLGLLDYLGNALLAPINSGFGEVTEFLQQSDMRGMFWSI